MGNIWLEYLKAKYHWRVPVKSGNHHTQPVEKPSYFCLLTKMENMLFIQILTLWVISMIIRASLIAQLVKNLPECRRPQFDSWVRKIHQRRNRLPAPVFSGFPVGSAGKDFVHNGGHLGSISRLERSSGAGNGYPLQYSDLENSLGFPGGASGKEPVRQCGKHKGLWFDPWVGKIPWRRNDNPLQYSCLGNPMDRGVWWATVPGVAESQTRLSRHLV